MSTLRYSTSGAKLALAALVAGSVALIVPMAAPLAAPAKGPQAEARSDRVKAAAGRVEAPAKAAAAKASPGKAAPKAEAGEAPELNEPQYTSAIAPAGEADNCVRQRRRLFVDGEGWIVRRVAICP